MNAGEKRQEYNDFLKTLYALADEYAATTATDIARIPATQSCTMYLFTPPNLLYNLDAYPEFRILFGLVVSILRKKYKYHVEWNSERPLHALISWVRRHDFTLAVNESLQAPQVPELPTAEPDSVSTLDRNAPSTEAAIKAEVVYTQNGGVCLDSFVNKKYTT